MKTNVTFGEWMLYGIFAPIKNKKTRMACAVVGVVLCLGLNIHAARQ